MTKPCDLSNSVNISVDKVILKGGHDKPLKKKDSEDSYIPINESHTTDLDYIED